MLLSASESDLLQSDSCEAVDKLDQAQLGESESAHTLMALARYR
jgi:hypothetical protein